jgi:uncharacterized protein YggE
MMSRLQELRERVEDLNFQAIQDVSKADPEAFNAAIDDLIAEAKAMEARRIRRLVQIGLGFAMAEPEEFVA